MTDKELIKRIKQGEKDLFEELIRRYYDDVYRFCYYKTSDCDASYDLTQETFLKLIKYFNSYQDKGKFKSYLFSIAVNICNNYYKKSADKSTDLDLVNESFYCHDHNEQITNRIITEELLWQLPEYQRETIVLKYFQGFKIREIAKITNEKIPTVKSRLKQGLEKMKDMVRSDSDE